MAVTKKLAFGISISWLKFGISSVFSLIQTPIIFSCLSKEKVGLWFIFSSIAQFILMTDLGVSAAIGRAISFIWGGSKAEKQTTPTHSYVNFSISDVYSTGVIVLFSVCIAILLIGGILLGIFPTGMGKMNLQGEHLAFLLFFIGVMLNLIAAVPCSALSAFGDVGFDNMSRLIGLVASFVFVVFILPVYKSLNILAISFLVQAIITSMLSFTILHYRHKTVRFIVGLKINLIKQLYKDGIPNFVTQAGIWLIFQSTMLIAVFYFSPSFIADFGVLRQLVAIGFSIIFSIPGSISPFAAIKYAEGNRASFLNLYHLAIKTSMMIASMWGVGLLIWGPTALCFWIGPNHFLGYQVLVPLVIMNMLEIHHAVNANFVWSSGKWPFAPWSIGAGILNVVFTFILCKYIGIAGLVVGTMLAQMMTQNWYVVYYALKRLEISWPAYFKNIVVPIAILILFAGVVTYFTKTSLESVIHAQWHIRHLAANNFIALFAGPIIVIICTSVVFSAIVLNKAERAIFFEKASVVLNKFKRNSAAKSHS